MSRVVPILFTLAVAALGDPRPSVVFILLDDVGWRDLACYGSDFHQTPHMDQLARDGMLFTQAYAASSTCSPTRASILTGQHPARLRITDYIPGENPGPLRAPHWNRQLKPGIPTMASLLRAAGYTTGFFGKWHLNRDKKYRPGRPGDPGSHGFDTVLATVRPNAESPISTDSHHATLITDTAIKFIAAQPPEQPFLCFVSHHLMHRPLLTSQPLPLPDPPPTLHKHPVYAGMLAELDREIGRLLSCLDKHGRRDNTLVVLTSDNGGYPGKGGDATSNAPLRGGKGTAYEGGIRVPTIVRWPEQVKAGAVCERPIISPDFLPTICDAAGVGLRQRDPIDGVSLLPLLRDPAGLWDRKALYWHYPHYHALGATPHSAIRFEDWKLIAFYEDQRFELYDLSVDPSESNNLIDARRQVAGVLKAQLAGWRNGVDAQLPRPAIAWYQVAAAVALGVLVVGYLLHRGRRGRGAGLGGPAP